MRDGVMRKRLGETVKAGGRCGDCILPACTLATCVSIPPSSSAGDRSSSSSIVVMEGANKGGGLPGRCRKQVNIPVLCLYQWPSRQPSRVAIGPFAWMGEGDEANEMAAACAAEVGRPGAWLPRE